MKNYGKVIVVSLIASSVAFTPVINFQVNAHAMDHNLFKIGGVEEIIKRLRDHI